MRWFKHLSGSHNDETMAELIAEFGAEGYGVWWVVLEKIAQEMDETDRCFARFSIKNWANSCGISAKKLQKIVSFLENRGRFSVEKDLNFITITCQNLLKYRDEFTKKRRRKSGSNPECVRSESGIRIQSTEYRVQNTDNTISETSLQGSELIPVEGGMGGDPNPGVCDAHADGLTADRDQAETTQPVLSSPDKRKPQKQPNCPHREILDLYHEILPELAPVRVFSDRLKANVRARCREDKARQNSEWWRCYWQLVSECGFLMGRNKTNWQATFAWLVLPTNMEKVLNGHYPRDGPLDGVVSDITKRNIKVGNRWLEKHGSKPQDKGET